MVSNRVLRYVNLTTLCVLMTFVCSMQNVLVACEADEQKSVEFNPEAVYSLPDGVRGKITEFIDPVTQIAQVRGLEPWSKHTIGTCSDAVSSVTWFPDGKRLLVATQGEDILAKREFFVWSKRENGSLIKQQIGPDDDLTDVAVMPDGGAIFSIGNNTQLLLWNKQADGSWIKQEIGIHGRSINCSAIAPDGKSIACLDDKHELFLWNKQEDGSWIKQEVGGHAKEIARITWSPDTTSIVAVGYNDLFVWSKRDDGLWINQKIPAHPLLSVVAWLPDSATFVSAACNTLYLWSHQDDGSWINQEIGRQDTRIHGVSVSPCGKSILSFDENNTIVVWNKRKNGLWDKQKVEKHDAAISSATWSPDGMSIVSGDCDKNVQLYKNMYTSDRLDRHQNTWMLDILMHMQIGKMIRFSDEQYSVYRALPEYMKKLINPFISKEYIQSREGKSGGRVLSDRCVDDSKDSEE